MATTAADRKVQDLPPKGGYSPIQTERIKLRTILGGKMINLSLISSLKKLKNNYNVT
jgi:hypothetical protein